MKQFLLIICAALLAAANLQAGGPVFGGGATVDTNALASGILTTAAANVAAGTNAQASGIITTAKAYTDAATNHGWRIYVPKTELSGNALSINIPLSTNALAYRFHLGMVRTTATGVSGRDYVTAQVCGMSNVYAYAYMDKNAGTVSTGQGTNFVSLLFPSAPSADNVASARSSVVIDFLNPSATNLTQTWKFNSTGISDSWVAGGNWMAVGTFGATAPIQSSGCTNITFFPYKAGAYFETGMTYRVEIFTQ